MLLGVLLVGGYFAFTRLEHEQSASAPQAPLTDPAPEQDRMQSMPAPQVSTRLESLPQSDSTAVFPASRKDGASNTSSNVH
jgi:hypothetical protein